MPFFEHLSDIDRVVLRRRGLLFVGLLNVLAAMLVVSYGIAAWNDFRSAIRGDPKLQITVTGEGTVAAKPDVARITATVLTQSSTLLAAQEENTRRSNAVVDFLKKSGIAEKDIKTVGYSIYPQYSYPRPCPLGVYPCPSEDQPPRIIGYQIRNSYEVTIRDLAKANDILAGVVSAGANEVSGVSFTIDDPDALQAEARQEAVDEARQKAQALADSLDMRLGRIINFSEGGTFPPPIFFERGLAVGGKGGDIAPSVQPGENEIVVTVNITYEFK